MSSKPVQQIEQAISTLSSQELDEFREWFDQFDHSLDSRLAADFAAGRLDHAIQRALNDEQSDRTRPL